MHLRPQGAFAGTLSQQLWVAGRRRRKAERQGGRFWEKEGKREAERGKNKQGLSRR